MKQFQSLPSSLFKSDIDIAVDIRFRLVERTDLRPLHTTCYPQHSFNQFRDHFDHMLRWQTNGRCYWLVAVEKSSSQVVGSGQLILYPHSAELANLVVSAEFRNQSIGTAIVHILTAVARHIGLDYLEIGVTADNQPALSLYQRLGFVEERQLQLPDGELSIILRKLL